MVSNATQCTLETDLLSGVPREEGDPGDWYGDFHTQTGSPSQRPLGYTSGKLFLSFPRHWSPTVRVSVPLAPTSSILLEVIQITIFAKENKKDLSLLVIESNRI